MGAAMVTDTGKDLVWLQVVLQEMAVRGAGCTTPDT